MKITNRHGLPKTIVNAIERDPYHMGDARISVTGLLKPPRISLLYKKYSDLIEKDVADNIWALFGQAIHSILERGGDEEHIPEERLFISCRGWRISGQVDLQKVSDTVVNIQDYKSTSAYAVMHDKPEWVEQTNCYAHLVRVCKGLTVQSLSIVAFVRDWNRHQAQANSDYPQSPCVVVPIPLWTPERAEAFIDERVRIHQDAQAGWDMGDDPPQCTDEERWMRTPTYAVVKQGNKRASKVFDDPTEATKYAEFRGAAFVVETRKAEPIRCSGDYCGVSQWCRQYADWKKSQGAE